MLTQMKAGLVTATNSRGASAERWKSREGVASKGAGLRFCHRRLFTAARTAGAFVGSMVGVLALTSFGIRVLVLLSRGREEQPADRSQLGRD